MAGKPHSPLISIGTRERKCTYLEATLRHGVEVARILFGDWAADWK